MPSPANWRPGAERIARVASLLSLAVLAGRLWLGSGNTGDVAHVESAALDSSLARWSLNPPAEGIVEATKIPSRQQRDWLVALRRAGLAVRWTTPNSLRGALVVESGALAGSPFRAIALTSPSGVVELFDALGRIDSSMAGVNGIVSWRVNTIGPATAEVGNATATAAPRDSFSTRPILVLGQADWESRFVMTALEENGWSVAARISVAPGAVVRQGAAVPIDTASLSAVVVLDSVSRLDPRELLSFVREGGGLVASGPGARHPALREIIPRAQAGSPGEIGALSGTTPRHGLSTRTFIANASTVPLERRGDAPVVVARRVGAGRVVGVGYDDTWRLRMVPTSASAPEGHRTWWSGLVGGVALVRPHARDVAIADEAPFAATVDALGVPAFVKSTEPRPAEWPWEAVLAAIAGCMLLAEWLSRRLRGLS